MLIAAKCQLPSTACLNPSPITMPPPIQSSSSYQFLLSAFKAMKQNMDDGEIELSNPVSTFSVDLIIGEYMKNTRTCTHTHTCNPPGPDDAAHSHTCYHTHTQLLTSEEDDHHRNNKGSSISNPKQKMPLGNREAVRKYREKKKAHTAYLEEEVKKLRLLNQQLVRKLQGQTILEAEVLRLRSLLVDIRAKIDGELGVFPFQKQCDNAPVLKEGGDAISVQFQTDLPCFHPHAGSSSSHASIGGNETMNISWEGNCQAATLNCQANEHNSDAKCGRTSKCASEF